MPFTIPVPEPFKSAGWKIKIREKERLESPHVTILHKMDAWRVDLRTGNLIDPGSKWSDVPEEIKTTIQSNWQTLGSNWNRMYPNNPV